MEKNNDTNLNRWVDDRLGTLRPETQWQPDPTQRFAQLRAQLHRGKAGRKRSLYVAAGIAGCVLLLLAFPATRTLADRYVSACVRLWAHFAASGSSLTYTEQHDRKVAPDFVLKDHSGAQVRLSDFRGKVVLLSFWDTKCAACNVEIPWFIEFQQMYRHRDFVVLSVALDKDGWTSVKPYIEEKQINHPVMAGTDEVARLYSDSIPTALIIDRSGRIAVTHVGLCAKREYETAIEATINEH